MQSSFFSSAEDPAGSAFLAHRTAELFSSFLTKHWSSSASTIVPGVFIYNPTQKSSLAALFSLAKVLCPRPGFKERERKNIHLQRGDTYKQVLGSTGHKVHQENGSSAIRKKK